MVHEGGALVCGDQYLQDLGYMLILDVLIIMELSRRAIAQTIKLGLINKHGNSVIIRMPNNDTYPKSCRYQSSRTEASSLVNRSWLFAEGGDRTPIRGQYFPLLTVWIGCLEDDISKISH